MRPELDGKIGNEYFAAWDHLMAVIGAEVIVYYLDLRDWADGDALEIGLYGATADKFDLPVKTLTVWFVRQGLLPRDLYDAVVSGYRVEQIKTRGVNLLRCRAEGLSYAEVLEAERVARQRQREERAREWRDKNFPAIESAFDKNGALIRIGDKCQIAWRFGEPEVVTVKELRVRAGKVVRKDDAKIFFESGGRLENFPAIRAVRLDAWFGE